MKHYSALVLAAAAAAMLVMPSCQKGEKKANVLSENQDSIKNLMLSDSLATIQAEKDTLASIMAEVSDGMNRILDMQNLMSSQSLSAETPDQKAQLRSNVLLIEQSVAKQNQRLADLEKRLKRSTIYSDEMQRNVATLKKQLANQKSIIDDLTGQLQAAHIAIKDLNTQVDSLNTANAATAEALTNETAERQRAQEESVRLANEMNTCYYVVGSKDELKQQKIIQTGFLRKTKVMEGDYSQSYFTKADRRSLSQINLHSTKAEILSKHPADSYRLETAGGQLVLKITNAARFWELSNYLVVQTK